MIILSLLRIMVRAGPRTGSQAVVAAGRQGVGSAGPEAGGEETLGCEGASGGHSMPGILSLSPGAQALGGCYGNMMWYGAEPCGAVWVPEREGLVPRRDDGRRGKLPQVPGSE